MSSVEHMMFITELTGESVGGRSLKSAAEDTVAAEENSLRFGPVAFCVLLVFSMGLFGCAFFRLRNVRMQLAMERFQRMFHRCYHVREPADDETDEAITTTIMNKLKLPFTGRQNNRPKPRPGPPLVEVYEEATFVLKELAPVPAPRPSTPAKPTTSLPYTEDIHGYTEVKILPDEIQVAEVDDNGYMEVLPEVAMVASPPQFSQQQSEYNKLGEHLVARPAGGAHSQQKQQQHQQQQKPPATCKAYDHVMLYSQLSLGHVKKGATDKYLTARPFGSEYDVSVLAKEAPRVMVIGEVYDRLGKGVRPAEV